MKVYRWSGNELLFWKKIIIGGTGTIRQSRKSYGGYRYSF